MINIGQYKLINDESIKPLKIYQLIIPIFYTKRIGIDDYVYEEINIEPDEEVITDGKCIDEEVESILKKKIVIES